VLFVHITIFHPFGVSTYAFRDEEIAICIKNQSTLRKRLFVHITIFHPFGVSTYAFGDEEIAICIKKSINLTKKGFLGISRFFCPLDRE
jgi:hypothetical protein